jgi:hypothetical protein
MASRRSFQVDAYYKTQKRIGIWPWQPALTSMQTMHKTQPEERNKKLMASLLREEWPCNTSIHAGFKHSQKTHAIVHEC